MSRKEDSEGEIDPAICFTQMEQSVATFIQMFTQFLESTVNKSAGKTIKEDEESNHSDKDENQQDKRKGKQHEIPFFKFPTAFGQSSNHSAPFKVEAKSWKSNCMMVNAQKLNK
jgi:hypothetical protein